MNAQALLDSFLASVPNESKPPTSLVALGNEENFESTGDQDLIFDLGSLTKIISTTAIILKLVENGTLNLDDPVSRFLSGNLFKEFTIKDVLSHRAGLWEWRPFYIELQNREQLIPRIAELPLRYKIGVQRHYSDLGFILLGGVIESLLGQPLDQVFNEMIAEPLGLSQTSYGSPKQIGKCIPSSFGDRAELNMVEKNSPYPVNADARSFPGWRTHILRGEINDGNAFHLMGGVSGHAGLFSSVRDVMVFGSELLISLTGNGYFNSLVLAEFFAFTKDPEQALGFQRYAVSPLSKLNAAYGHTGFPGVALAVIPDRNITLGLFSNRLLVDGVPLQTAKTLAELISRT
jgi:CubicO group peptidase (beta-lactamase class C family)